MPNAGLLTRGLGYEHCGSDLVVCAHAQPADLTLRFRFADQRCHTAVVVLDGKRPIELSGQPSAVTELVSTAAVAAGADANAWMSVIERVVRAEAAASGCRFPDPVTDAPREALERLIGALRYLLLAAAYQAGYATERFIPRWARSMLEAHDAKSAGRVAFGERSTRPVVRALGTALTDPPAVGAVEAVRVPWATFGLALAATQSEPDELVMILARREQQTSSVFSVDDLSLIRWAARFVGRAHFHRLAEESLEHDLVPQLLRTMRTLHLVRAVITRPFPMQLDELEHMTHAVAAATTRPRPVYRPPDPPGPQRAIARPAEAPPAAAQVAGGRAPAPAWTRALHPPRRNDVRPPAPTFTYAPEITALDGVAIGSLMLRVPSRPAQRYLSAWGVLTDTPV